jgi:hypothetical protein
MAAIKAAIASTTNKAVLYEDAVYDLGANYIPLVSGVSHIGYPTVFRFSNGDWGDRNYSIASGTRINTTNARTFWDGLADLAAVTTTVPAANATFTSGSTNVGVVNSANYPVGASVYFTTSGNGFYSNLSYFVLSSAANVLTLGLADKVAISATSNSILQISSGTPNESTTGILLQDIAFPICKTAIKSGAKNAIGAAYCTFDNLYAIGTIGYKAFDFTNYVHCDFFKMFSRDGGGQYYGVDIPSTTLQPGNSNFTDIYNINSNTTSDATNGRGIRFVAQAGSQLNEVHVRQIQNNYKGISTVTQTSSALTNASPSIPVPSSAAFPVDMPVWISTVGNPNGFTSWVNYFVVSSAANIIQLSATMGGAAVISTGTAAMIINTQGFPAIELVGIGSGIITASDMLGIDVEGTSTIQVLAQNAGAYLSFNQSETSANTRSVVCGRTATLSVENRHTAFSTEYDAASVNSVLIGQRGTPTVSGYAGAGLYRDNSSNFSTPIWVLNLHPFKSQAYPSIKGVGGSAGDWVQTGLPLGMNMNTQDLTATIGGGWTTFNGAAAQTLTLPTIVNTSSASTMVGMPYYISNSSANAVVINTSSSQLLNNIAGKTTMTLQAGQYIKCTAANTAGGTLYWIAETNGTI